MNDSWANILRHVNGQFDTPFFLLSPRPFLERFRQLADEIGIKPVGVPVRHWYSFKTQPVPSMLLAARSLGFGVEVVSPFELHAARRLNLPPSEILINGVSKHRWIPPSLEGVTVIFDSLDEVDALTATARRNSWRVGLRIAVSAQIDPDAPAYPAQFGLAASDAVEAVERFRKRSISIDLFHFHLRSNVPVSTQYLSAAREVGEIVRMAGIHRLTLDVGGGLPDPDVRLHDADGSPESLSLTAYAESLRECVRAVPGATELWLENGRFLTGPSGVLVVTVTCVKRIGNLRFLICDGGRTNHALQSDWEVHRVEPALGWSEPVEPTAICGPTCMAYDWLYRGNFPSSVCVGDRLIYFNAGAYHIPWETRFSHGLCRVLWEDGARGVVTIREPEPCEEWFGRWRTREHLPSIEK